MKSRSSHLIAAVLLLLFLLPAAAAAQVSNAGVIFLTIEPGARNAGIGGAGVALGVDSGPTASFYNPAALAFIPGTSFTGMHNKALPELVDDFYYEFLGGTHSFGPAGGIGGNITFYSYGSQLRTDGSGNELGTIESYDLAASASYGVKVKENLAVGGTFKVIYSNLSPVGAEAEKGDGRAFTFAVDAGILFTDVVPRLNLGIVWQNVGPDIAYIDRDQADPLPQNLRVGIAWQAVQKEQHRLTLVYDAYKSLAQRDKSFLVSAIFGLTDDKPRTELEQIVHMGGVEYVFADLIALRTGYFYDSIGVVKYPTFGVGISWRSYHFDLSHAYSPDKPYSQGTRVSVSLVF